METIGADKKRISIEPALMGGYTLFINDIKNNARRYIHSKYSPQREAAKIVESISYSNEKLYVFLGLGLGYHIKEFLNRYKEAKVVIVEYSEEIYEYAKIYGVINDIEKNIEILIGKSIENVINHITHKQLKNKMIQLEIIKLNSLFNIYYNYYKQIYEKIRFSSKSLLRKLLCYEKFKKEDITVIVFDFGYFLRLEILNALKKLGLKAEIINCNKNESISTILKELSETILAVKPDFILTINHLGFDTEGILTQFLKSIEMPVAVWYVDSPNIIVRPYKDNISDNIVLFLWDWAYKDDMKKVGFENIYYLPLASDTEVFYPINLSKKAKKRYQSKIAFVGNSMINQIIKKKGKLSNEYLEIAHNIANELSYKRMTFEDLINIQPEDIKSKLKKLKDEEYSTLETLIYWIATRIYRSRVLKKTIKYSPTIYGDKGWKQLLDGSFELRGEVNYYKTLPVVYNATDININATSLQMPEGVNQRVFDVPACGAFLLTDYQKAIEELFDIGKEVVVYKNIEELPELIKYYLKNDTERKKIAERAYRRVISEHTYVLRLKKIIETMKRIFA